MSKNVGIKHSFASRLTFWLFLMLLVALTPISWMTSHFLDDVANSQTRRVCENSLMAMKEKTRRQLSDVYVAVNNHVHEVEEHMDNLDELSKVLKVELDREMATCLYTGIATDTGFFNYSNTRPSTLRAAAALLEAGVKPNEISEQIEKKSLTDVMGEIETLQTTKVFFEGKAVGLFIDGELSKRIDSTEGFIDLVRIIDGVDVAFLVHCKAENFCRVSMRSKNVDVSKIAHKLGGGGHVRAAGCSIAAPFEEAKMIIIHAIGEALNAHLQPTNE